MAYWIGLLICSNVVLLIFLARQRKKINSLMHCPTFNCLSRQGIDEYWRRKRDKKGLALIFLDIDDMHVLNQEYGHFKVDEKLSRAFSLLRAEEVLGRWYSGDELIVITPSPEATAAAERVKEGLMKEGVSATFSIVSINEEKYLSDVVKRGSALVQQSKNSGVKGIIIDSELISG